MQGFIISSAIFIKQMLKLLNREFNIGNTFSYADDDIVICVYSIVELHKATNIINKWIMKLVYLSILKKRNS